MSVPQFHAKDLLVLEALRQDGGWWEKRISPRLVDRSDGCTIWNGALTHDGYGKVGIPHWVVSNRSAYVHRVAWIHATGAAIPTDTLDHLCRVRKCANVQHLEPTSMRENNLRGDSPPAVQLRMTHCKNGHELAEENIDANQFAKYGQRRCVTCRKEQDRERFALVMEAHRATGLSYREYVRIHGQSRHVAEMILNGGTDVR